MATKTTTAKKVAEKKVETTPVKEVKATAAKKVEAKATEPKKETVKKAEAKPATKKATKTAEPKKEAVKPATKTAEPKKATAKKENNLFVQFAGMEFDTKAIEKAVKEDYLAKNGKKTMTSVSIYVKPEDMKAYYVIDGIIGDVAL